MGTVFSETDYWKTIQGWVQANSKHTRLRNYSMSVLVGGVGVYVSERDEWEFCLTLLEIILQSQVYSSSLEVSIGYKALLQTRNCIES
jgi:hypothetical protein